MPSIDRLQRIQATQSAALEAVYALHDARKKIEPCDEYEIEALKARISLCNRSDNIWFADDAYDQSTGEAFDAVGKFWRCESKLCPSCLAHHAQRCRKKFRDAVEHHQLRPGQYWYFATFTIVNPRRSIAVTRSIVNRCWRLFSKRKLCRDLVFGGVKSEEFTVTSAGIHYHIHSVLKAGFLRYNLVRAVWSECMERAFEEAGVPLEFNTSDGMAIIKIERVRRPLDLANELCKYMTKSDSWKRLPAEHLIEAALIKRIPRMFEIFGDLKQPSAEKPIVHTRDLSAAARKERSQYWRDRLKTMLLSDYLSELELEFARSENVRREQLSYRWPAVPILTLNQVLDSS